jgi:hypothetical protein
LLVLARMTEVRSATLCTATSPTNGVHKGLLLLDAHGHGIGQRQCAPLPHLFPCLDESLEGSRAGDATFLEAARVVRLTVEILNVLRAQERQASLELFQVFLTPNVVFAYVGTPGHSASSLMC